MRNTLSTTCQNYLVRGWGLQRFSTRRSKETFRLQGRRDCKTTIFSISHFLTKENKSLHAKLAGGPCKKTKTKTYYLLIKPKAWKEIRRARSCLGPIPELTPLVGIFTKWPSRQSWLVCRKDCTNPPTWAFWSTWHLLAFTISLIGIQANVSLFHLVWVHPKEVNSPPDSLSVSPRFRAKLQWGNTTWGTCSNQGKGSSCRHSDLPQASSLKYSKHFFTRVKN